jgi:DNA-binding CsgD family transcriptional regulator
VRNVLSETLLASVYAIATDEGAFQQASAAIAEALGYRHGLLGLNGPKGPIEIALNQPDAIMAGYQDYYHKLDPWAVVAARSRYGDPIVMDPDASKRFYDTEFYVDFAHPIGMVDPLGIKMPLEGGTVLMVGLNQPLHSHRPTDEDASNIVALGRHLQRAVQLRQQFRGAVAEKGALMAALDRVAFGIAVTTADGRIQALNAEGERVIVEGCGLQVRGGHLLARDSSMAGALALMIRDASNGGAGGALRLRAGADHFANVLVAPLPQASSPTGGSLTLVAFRQTGAPTHLDAGLLMSTFGLSRGEAQVAVALMEGKSGEEIALARGVKATTIKSQLQALFLKTGTNSQRELVRYLAGLPALIVR